MLTVISIPLTETLHLIRMVRSMFTSKVKNTINQIWHQKYITKFAMILLVIVTLNIMKVWALLKICVIWLIEMKDLTARLIKLTRLQFLAIQDLAIFLILVLIVKILINVLI